MLFHLENQNKHFMCILTQYTISQKVRKLTLLYKQNNGEVYILFIKVISSNELLQIKITFYGNL